MLLHRYQNIEYILDLDAETGLALIQKAMEQTRDDRLWLQWAIQLPVMGLGGNFISLKDYRDRMTGSNIDMRSTAAILHEVNEIEQQFEEGES